MATELERIASVLRAPLLGYAVALAATALALGSRIWLGSLLEDRVPFASFFAAVAITAWFGGFGPCLLAVVLGAIASWYFVLDPEHTFTLRPFQIIGLIAFVLTGLTIAGFSGVARRTVKSLHTSKREAERARQILDSLLANAPEGITMAGAPPNFPIIAQSQYAARFLGSSAAATFGVSAGVHLSQGAILRADGTVPAMHEIPLFRATRFGETVRNEEWILKRQDGHLAPVLVDTVPIRDDHGFIVGGIGCWRDISEHKALIEALRESDDRFRATFEQAAVGLAHVGLDGRWIRVNDRLCQMTGYARDELLEKTFQEITHPDDLQTDLAQVAMLLAGDTQSYALEKRYVRRDGSILWIGLTVSLLTKDENPLYFIAVIEDISQRKTTERELQVLHAELEHRVEKRTAELEIANRELESFSYSVSHDLRAPIRAINGYSYLLLHEQGSCIPPEARRYIERIGKNSKRMGQLVDDLLEFVRLGRSPLNFETVDLSEIASQSVAELRETAGDRRVEVHLDPIPPCRCDAALMRHVLDNLLANAFKFTCYLEQAAIAISATVANDEVVVCVKDNGPGFDAQYGDKLFKVFQRLHAAEEFEGTGVGLAVVKRIIERHGGRVWATSELGQGAAFYFSLHTARQPGVEAVAAASAGAG